MRSIRSRLYIVIMLAAWLAVVTGLGAWNVMQAIESQDKIYLEGARSFFDLVLITRQWNSLHGGVYLPVRSDTQPNPYLDAPNRDVTTTNGIELTLVNPAYMTRMISELAAASNNRVKFHITSLKPIRPANAADAWETSALQGFETTQLKEYYETLGSGPDRTFRYMAPLYVVQSCMACHAKQGYQVGDVRGGISVSFPVSYGFPWTILASHFLIGLAGCGLITWYGSRLSQAVKSLEDLTVRDSLTGIYNRRFLDEIMEREIAKAARNGHSISVGFCDIDNFKAYNDIYGHQAGDECLRKVAQALAAALKRGGDVVVRYGGEEFCFILPGTNREGALAVGEKLLECVRDLKMPHQGSAVTDHVTISIGMTTSTDKDAGQDELLKQADEAMYRAKSQGKNMVFVYEKR